MIKYQDGILAFDLRFIKRDPDAIKTKKRWEEYGRQTAQDIIDSDVDPREMFMQAKRADAFLTGLLSGLARYVDSFFSKEDESYMGVKLSHRKTIGGGVQYKKNESYRKVLEELEEIKEELQAIIRQANKVSRYKDPDAKPWEKKYYSPITGEEFVFTEDDAVPETGREGFVYFI